MASKQSEAVRRRWEAAMLAVAHPGGEGLVDDESWGDLTSEPREVDYLETEAGGLPAMWVVPKRASDRVLLCLHGGGFLSGSIYTHRKMFAHMAKAAGSRALLVGYHLLGEGGVYPMPAVEVVSVYRWLLEQGTTAAHVAFTGDSAGGWLAVSVQLRARDQGLPIPAAALLISPIIDMEATGKSYETNRDRDPFFSRELVRGVALSFLGGTSPRDPLASPLYADLGGLSPIYIQTGGDEALLDDSLSLYEIAGKAGVDVRLDVFPEMLHTFQMAAGRAPEADDAIRRMGEWVRPRLGL